MKQIVGVLKQAEVGVPVAEVIRKAGINEQTFYRWKAKYAGLGESKAIHNRATLTLHLVQKTGQATSRQAQTLDLRAAIHETCLVAPPHNVDWRQTPEPAGARGLDGQLPAFGGCKRYRRGCSGKL